GPPSSDGAGVLHPEVAPHREWTGCSTRVQTEDRIEKDFQRWTARRNVELLLQLIKGEVKLVDVCREHDLTQSEVEGWMEVFLKAGEPGLKARTEDQQATHEREVRELRAKVGELVLELDARKKLDA